LTFARINETFGSPPPLKINLRSHIVAKVLRILKISSGKKIRPMDQSKHPTMQIISRKINRPEVDELLACKNDVVRDTGFEPVAPTVSVAPSSASACTSTKQKGLSICKNGCCDFAQHDVQGVYAQVASPVVPHISTQDIQTL
jgi:hypothetical protein